MKASKPASRNLKRRWADPRLMKPSELSCNGLREPMCALVDVRNRPAVVAPDEWRGTRHVVPKITKKSPMRQLVRGLLYV
jgi:hypothetical protein